MKYIARLVALVVGVAALCVAAFCLAAQYMLFLEAWLFRKVHGATIDNSAASFVLVALFSLPVGLGLIGVAMRKSRWREYLTTDAPGVLLLLVAAFSSVHAYAILSDAVPREGGANTAAAIASLLGVVALGSLVAGAGLLLVGLWKTRWRDNVVLDVLSVALLFLALLPWVRFGVPMRVASWLISMGLLWMGMRKTTHRLGDRNGESGTCGRGETGG